MKLNYKKVLILNVTLIIINNVLELIFIHQDVDVLLIILYTLIATVLFSIGSIFTKLEKKNKYLDVNLIILLGNLVILLYILLIGLNSNGIITTILFFTYLFLMVIFLLYGLIGYILFKKEMIKNV